LNEHPMFRNIFICAINSKMADNDTKTCTLDYIQ
jgi:hypothetical protein